MVDLDFTEFAGTRHDPHVQARSARLQPLLLHSMSVFRELFEIVFAHRSIATVVEVGVESGAVSGIYAELGATEVFCVEPAPTDALRRALHREPLRLVEADSPSALTELPIADLYVLDGDHNYAVVVQEVRWLLRNAPAAVIVLHDLLWPSGRRDAYYQPSPLPESDRLPSSSEGPTVWHDELTPAGFVGLGAFESALRAGGERNGVLTAVEDALAECGDDRWRLAVVPAVFGMGILLREKSDADAALLTALRPYTSSRLLAMLENNRIALYTRVLQYQYEAERSAENTDLMAEEISRQRAEIAQLNAELAEARAILGMQNEQDADPDQPHVPGLQVS